MKIVNRDTFYICGQAVETSAEQNNKDISALYGDFFNKNEESVIANLQGCKKGYFGLSWYTQRHEKYCYMLGIEVDKENQAPENMILKAVPKATYAVAYYTHNKDIIEAWNEFFYSEIPNQGYAPNEQLNLYFEFYPESVHGDYELWVPVVEAN